MCGMLIASPLKEAVEAPSWYLTLEGEVSAYHHYQAGGEMRVPAEKKSSKIA
jgi:hypothetical protein